MYTTHDASHATNVANFEALINYCANTIGARYNPGLPKHQLTNLRSRLTATKQLMAALHTALENNSESIRLRAEAFESLAPLASRVVNTYLICNVTDAQRESMKSLLKKIQGKRIGPKPATGVPAPGTEPVTTVKHAAAQQTYVDLAEHFASLIEKVNGAPDYSPNENDLKLTSLLSFQEHINELNSTVMEQGSKLDKARIDRNRSLYRRDDGLVPLAKEVKLYVGSACGKTSAECKHVKAIPFKDYKFDEPLPTEMSGPAS